MTTADPIPAADLAEAMQIVELNIVSGDIDDDTATVITGGLIVNIAQALADRARNAALVSEAVAGWKLVPVEPTEAMLTAGRLARMNIEGGYGGPSSWEAMLAAAPSRTPTQEKPEGDHG